MDWCLPSMQHVSEGLIPIAPAFALLRQASHAKDPAQFDFEGLLWAGLCFDSAASPGRLLEI